MHRGITPETGIGENTGGMGFAAALNLLKTEPYSSKAAFELPDRVRHFGVCVNLRVLETRSGIEYYLVSREHSATESGQITPEKAYEILKNAARRGHLDDAERLNALYEDRRNVEQMMRDTRLRMPHII